MRKALLSLFVVGALAVPAYAQALQQGENQGIMQAYLAWSRTMEGFARDVGPDEAAQRRAQFVVSLLTEASAPTNTLVGNPAALKAALDSRGQSLANGLRNLLDGLADQ